MSFISGFRKDFASTIFKFSAKVWLPYCVANLLQTIITWIVVGSLFAGAVNWSNLMSLAENPDLLQEMANDDPMQILEFFFGTFSLTRMLGLAAIAILIMIVVSSWTYNFYFKINDLAARKNITSIGDSLKSSFDSTIWKILAASLVMGVIVMLLYGVMVLGMLASGLTLIITFPLMLLVAVKLLLIIPAIVHGKMGISDAIGYSWKHITWKRAALLVLIGIAAMLGLIIALVIVSVILMIFSLIPLLGFVIQLVGQIAIGAFVYALIYGTQSGLYFRYSNDPEEELGGMKTEDHLIVE